MVTRACLRYAREGQNVTQAGPKCHTSRSKMSHKGQNVTQSCYNIKHNNFCCSSYMDKNCSAVLGDILLRCYITLKRKCRQVDSLDIHWRRWRQASTSPVNIKAVNLTTFPFLCTSFVLRSKTFSEIQTYCVTWHLLGPGGPASWNLSLNILRRLITIHFLIYLREMYLFWNVKCFTISLIFTT